MTTTTPRVSIVIAAYQAQQHIEAAVASCLTQTYRDVEVIVLDDGSSDATSERVAAIIDPRVRLVRSDKNEGLAVVHNSGLALARGELIARLDADDFMLPERIARQVAHLDAHPEIGLVGTRAHIVEAGEPPRVFYQFDGRCLHWRLHYHCSLLHPTVMMRRAAIPPGGYPTASRYSHDWGLFLRIGRRWRIESLPFPGIVYRRHPAAIGIGAREAQHANAALVFGGYLDETFGLRPRASTLQGWVAPWTGAQVEDPAELAALARFLAPDAADLGPAAPPWDAVGLARARREHVIWLMRIMRSAPRRLDITRHLAPLVAAAMAKIVARQPART